MVPRAATRQTAIATALVLGAVLGIVLSGHVGGYFHDHPLRVHL